MKKFLTREIVAKLGLNKVKVITADMLYGYTNIDCFAFQSCPYLEAITIPKNIKCIGYGAFENCIGLTSVTIGNNSVTSIEGSAFAFCSSLTSITIPNSVISIGGYAFSHCVNLETIDIPDSVTIIGNAAFSNCVRLAFAKIGKSVTTIGNNAFIYCKSLKSITIPKSVTGIEYCAFAHCSNLSSVTIPDSVRHIGDCVLWDSSNLKSITIGDKEYKNHEVVNGKCKAYKAFNADMTCRNFQYKEGKTYEFYGEPKLCECGFHACLNLFDVFDYYSGRINEEFVVCEVELEGVTEEHAVDSKVAAKKITIGKRIL